MIKVIEEGVVPRGQITCPNCRSILEYGNANTHDDCLELIIKFVYWYNNI